MSDEIQTLTPEPAPSTAFMSLEEAFSFAPGATLAESPSDTTPAQPVDTEPKIDANAPAGHPDAVVGTPANVDSKPKGEPAKPNEQGGETAENVPWHKDPRWQAWKEKEREFEAQKPLLDFAQKTVAEWGSIEAYNKAVSDAATASQQAEATNAEAAIWAEAQGLVDSGDMSETAASRYAQSQIATLKAKQESAATKAQLAALQPTFQSIQQQQAQAELEKSVQTQFASLQAQYPQMDPDAVYAALYNGVKNPEGFAQRSHERIVSEIKKVQEAAEAKFEEERTKYLRSVRDSTPPPVGSTPGMVPAGQARIDPNQRISIADVFNGKYG